MWKNCRGLIWVLGPGFCLKDWLSSVFLLGPLARCVFWQARNHKRLLKMSGNIEDYEVLNVIGTGSFGTCYKVQKKSNGHLYVWKAVGYGGMSEEKKQRLVSEVNLLSELRHPNIVQYFDRIIHKETATLYIVMEWCEGGDLATLITKCKKSNSFLDEEFIWRVLYQMCRALHECHWNVPNITILHRDIKPANVFLDRVGNVKLGDFGLARILHKDANFAQTLVGTPYYMSPEVIKGGKYNIKSDIWSLGCLVYELCSLSPPFIGPNIKHLSLRIKEGKFSRIPAHYSDDLQKIISLLLSVEHKFRPTIEMILHHPIVVTHIAQETFKTMIVRPENESTKLWSNNKKMDDIPNIVQNLHALHLPSSGKTIFPGETESESCKEDTSEKVRDIWLNRFHILKQREASLRLKELDIDERERAVAKKEKKLALLDRLTNEKMTRADIYLRQCREARSVASSVKNLQQQQHSRASADLDTSLSADPGDTSIIPTSTKLNPEYVIKPSPFLRVFPEKRVHFNTLPMTKLKENQYSGFQLPAKHTVPQAIHQSGDLPDPLRRNHNILYDIQEHVPSKVSKLHDKKELREQINKNPLNCQERAEEDNLKNDVLSCNKFTSRSSNANMKRSSSFATSLVTDRTVWLQNKRHAYHLLSIRTAHRTGDKENTATECAEFQDKNIIKSVGVSTVPVPKSAVGSLSSFR